jgi:hypothetical protein
VLEAVSEEAMAEEIQVNFIELGVEAIDEEKARRIISYQRR